MREETAFVLEEGGKMLIEPYIENLPELFVSYFKAILKVGYNIPRLEYYMSQGKCVSSAFAFKNLFFFLETKL